MSSSKAFPIANLPALLIAGAIMFVGAGSAQATQFSGVIDTSAAFSPTNQSADGTTYFNAPASGPFSLLTIGEFAFTIPMGEAVTAVALSGNFGSDLLGSGTAPVDLFLNGIAVATCDANCAFNSTTADVPWSYNFSAGQLASLSSGHAILTAVQTAPSQIVLDPTSITVTAAPVPEPASALLFGIGLIAFLARRISAVGSV